MPFKLTITEHEQSQKQNFLTIYRLIFIIKKIIKKKTKNTEKKSYELPCLSVVDTRWTVFSHAEMLLGVNAVNLILIQ